MKKPKPRKSSRERQRIATIKERHGDDFFEDNGRRAATFTKTKFNSLTGARAANIRWARERARKANQ
jgi:hypothetical protein